MTKGTLTIAAFVSAFLFPWPFTAILALFGAAIEPFVPLSVGIFTDTLYYSSHTGTTPVFSLFGAAATAIAFFVRSRLMAGIIG